MMIIKGTDIAAARREWKSKTCVEDDPVLVYEILFPHFNFRLPYSKFMIQIKLLLYVRTTLRIFLWYLIKVYKEVRLMVKLYNVIHY